MEGIQKIHEEVFNLLKNEHEKNPGFLFTMRKTNRYNRLEKGYWFLGNDKYLSVSFWSGMDWMNKTSNMYFQINNDKSCYFYFTAKDSYHKLEFAKKKVVPLFDNLENIGVESIYNNNKVFCVKFREGKYIENFKSFLVEIKPKIDSLLKEFESDYEGQVQYSQEHFKKYGTKYEFTERDDNYRPLGFLDVSEFQESLIRINKYRQSLFLNEVEGNKFYLKRIEINKVGDIRNKLTIDLPKNASWIFLTGENGCGKTTILRAITAIFNREIIISSKYSLFSKISEIKFNTHSTNPNDDPIAFAAYGPSRLISTSCKSFLDDNLFNEKTKPWYSIFHPDGILFGFEELQRIYKDDPKKLDNIISFLEEMFNQKDNMLDSSASNDSSGELLPQIAEVNFKKFITEGKILYKEKDNENIPYEDYHSFEELASGVRSLLALIADLLIKLIERNLDEPDPANFKAVVLIDEIDIHFHPSMQKKIVEILSGSFPKVQFIVTTHSPVTLLGAPKNSVFYKISRTVEKGIYAEMIDIDISDLLPNSILSSPIFSFHELFPISHNKLKKIRTENFFEDILKNDKLKEYLKNVANNLENRL